MNQTGSTTMATDSPDSRSVPRVKTPSKHVCKHGRARPSARWLSPLFLRVFQRLGTASRPARHRKADQGRLRQARYHFRYRS